MAMECSNVSNEAAQPKQWPIKGFRLGLGLVQKSEVGQIAKSKGSPEGKLQPNCRETSFPKMGGFSWKRMPMECIHCMLFWPEMRMQGNHMS